jgi:hypothetical protein
MSILVQIRRLTHQLETLHARTGIRQWREELTDVLA